MKNFAQLKNKILKALRIYPRLSWNWRTKYSFVSVQVFDENLAPLRRFPECILEAWCRSYLDPALESSPDGTAEVRLDTADKLRALADSVLLLTREPDENALYEKCAFNMRWYLLNVRKLSRADFRYKSGILVLTASK